MDFRSKILDQNGDPNKFQTAIDSMDRVAKSSFQWCKITPEGDIVAVGLLQRILDLFKNIFRSKNDQFVDFYDKSLVELRFLRLFENCGENILRDSSPDNIEKIKNALVVLRANDSIKHKELEEVNNSVQSKDFANIPGLVERFLKTHSRSVSPLFGRVELLSVPISVPSEETRTDSRATEPDRSTTTTPPTTTPSDESSKKTEETTENLEEITQAPNSSGKSTVLSQETDTPSKTEPDSPPTATSSTTIPSDEIPTKTEETSEKPKEISQAATPSGESTILSQATAPSSETKPSDSTTTPPPTTTPSGQSSKQLSVELVPAASPKTTPPVKLSKRPSVLKTAFLGLLAFSGLGVLARNYLNPQTSMPLKGKPSSHSDSTTLGWNLSSHFITEPEVCSWDWRADQSNPLTQDHESTAKGLTARPLKRKTSMPPKNSSDSETYSRLDLKFSEISQKLSELQEIANTTTDRSFKAGIAGLTRLFDYTKTHKKLLKSKDIEDDLDDISRGIKFLSQAIMPPKGSDKETSTLFLNPTDTTNSTDVSSEAQSSQNIYIHLNQPFCPSNKTASLTDSTTPEESLPQRIQTDDQSKLNIHPFTSQKIDSTKSEKSISDPLLKEFHSSKKITRGDEQIEVSSEEIEEFLSKLPEGTSDRDKELSKTLINNTVKKINKKLTSRSVFFEVYKEKKLNTLKKFLETHAEARLFRENEIDILRYLTILATHDKLNPFEQIPFDKKPIPAGSNIHYMPSGFENSNNLDFTVLEHLTDTFFDNRLSRPWTEEEEEANISISPVCFVHYYIPAFNEIFTLSPDLQQKFNEFKSRNGDEDFDFIQTVRNIKIDRIAEITTSEDEVIDKEDLVANVFDFLVRKKIIYSYKKLTEYKYVFQC